MKGGEGILLLRLLLFGGDLGDGSAAAEAVGGGVLVDHLPAGHHDWDAAAGAGLLHCAAI